MKLAFVVHLSIAVEIRNHPPFVKQALYAYPIEGLKGTDIIQTCESHGNSVLIVVEIELINTCNRSVNNNVSFNLHSWLYEDSVDKQACQLGIELEILLVPKHQEIVGIEGQHVV